MSKKILILQLWPKKLSANQIPWLLFQTLTKFNCKEFSEFLLDGSGNDLIVRIIFYHHIQIACPGKLGFLSYGPKSSWPIRLLDYFFGLWQRTTVRNFLNFYMMIVGMILYHDVQTACPGKFWFLRKTLVLKLHLTSNWCLKGQKLCFIYLFYIIYLHFIYFHIFYYIDFSSLWCCKSSVLSYADNQKFLVGFADCKLYETSNSETFFSGNKYKLKFNN